MRNQLTLALVGISLLTATQVSAQNADSLYRLEYEPAVARTVNENGVSKTKIKVRFTVTRQGQEVTTLDTAEYKVFIYVEGKKVAEEKVPRVRIAKELSVILAVDTSGSMREKSSDGKSTRMDKAKEACNVFFANLPAGADAGLIIFDHEILQTLPLSKQRAGLIAHINAAQPRGGTAYRDACLKAIDMLSHVTGREKAVVVMTDGVDLNSKISNDELIAAANKAKVHIYPIGIGNPGSDTPVTSVVVLDKSGSMLLPASDTEKVSKLDALKRAALRFVEILPNKAHVRSSILKFSSAVTMPSQFTNNQAELNNIIKQLKAEGETALLDATYDAIEALEAENPPGKKAIVALTDGIDNTSRRRKEEVIKRAKDAGVNLYMLGFGKKNDLDGVLLYEMANQTGGAYYHAKNQTDLLQIFEHLSIQIHDDGVDEKALTELANSTGGRYYAAQNVNQLKLILESVSKGIQRKEYEVEFDSPFQRADGLVRDVRITLAKRDGSVVGSGPAGGANDGFKEVQTGTTGYQAGGLIVAQLSPIVYLGFLVLFGFLIAVPMGLSRMKQKDTAR